MWTAWPEECLLPEGRWLCVGDIQNGYDVLPYLESRKDIRKLFLGDFLDSWERSEGEQVQAFERILGMIERGEAIGVPGNHEVAYLSGLPGLSSTGNKSLTKALLMPIKRKAEKLLKPFFYHERTRTLFSHAGLSNKVWDMCEMDFDTLPTVLHGWALSYESPYYWIGRARGGSDPCGGLLWCDWHHEFAAVPGMSQVVGHTSSFSQKGEKKDGVRIGNLRVRGSSWNVDCLGRPGDFNFLVFDTSDGSFTGMTVNRGDARMIEVEEMSKEFMP